MKAFKHSDFETNEAWLILRLDARVANEYVDVYMVMHPPSEVILAHDIVSQEMTQQKADRLFKKCASQGSVPSCILITSGDPAESFFRQSATAYSMTLETHPAARLDGLSTTVKKTFGEHFSAPSTIGHVATNATEDEREALKYFIPDSYHQCPCASGKKYKFCCKKIITEITYAMVAAEEGHKEQALKWIKEAKDLVGETAEVLCREAIVYSFFDAEKSHQLLEQCLELNPRHPRAHYIRAINLKEQGDFNGAISAYQTAINYYPETDHFHLNEAYNNLGTVMHAINDLAGAKSAWEKALLYMPTDKMTQQNLREFIYAREKKVF